MEESGEDETGKRLYGLVPFPELQEEVQKLGTPTVALSQLTQLRKAVLSRARDHDWAVCDCECCHYVTRMVSDVATIAGVSSVEMKGLCTIGEFNSGSVCKEDAFRGRIHFVVHYSFSDGSMLEPSVAQKEASALVSKILERFDSMLVRCRSNWGSKDAEKRRFVIQLMCRTTGVNKSVTGRRKGKKEDGTIYVKRQDRIAASGDNIPCCARAYVVCTAAAPRNLTAGSMEFKIDQLHVHSTAPSLMGPYFLSRHDTFARQTLFECFDLGMLPKQARVHLDAELQLLAHSLAQEDETSLVLLHTRMCTDSRYRPTPRQVARLFEVWKNMTSSGDTVDGLTPYDAAVKSASDWEAQERRTLESQPGVKVGAVGWGVRSVYLTASRWGLVIVPPLAARLHCSTPQSAEIVFADATSSLTTSSDKLVCLYSCVSGTAIPLGYLVLSASDEELVTSALREYATLLGSAENCAAFYNGERDPSTGVLLGPQIFMSDCDITFKNAWSRVFPRSKHLLCHWHLWRAVWQNLQSYTRSSEMKSAVWSSFKCMVYARSEEEWRLTWTCLRDLCEQHQLRGFWEYVEGQWYSKKAEFVLYCRQSLPGWRNHNTNNVCESQFCVIKDFIFTQTGARSYPHFIRRICYHLQAWYRTTLFDRVFDTSTVVKTHRRAFFRGLPQYPYHAGDACKLLDTTVPLYAVKSITRADEGHLHEANLSTGFCTCEKGTSGSICKHQVLAWQRHIESLGTSEAPGQTPCPLLFPIWTFDDKKLFYFLATGRQMINVQAMVQKYNDCYATVQRQDQKLRDTNDQNADDCTGDDIDAGILQEQDQCAAGAEEDGVGVVGEQDQSVECAVDADFGVAREQDTLASPPDGHGPISGVQNYPIMQNTSHATDGKKRKRGTSKTGHGDLTARGRSRARQDEQQPLDLPPPAPATGSSSTAAPQPPVLPTEECSDEALTAMVRMIYGANLSVLPSKQRK